MKKTPEQLLAPDSLAFALLAAARTVLAVTEGRTLDAALASCWKRQMLSPQMRAAVQDLSYGTLRMGGRNDFFLQRLLRSPLADELVYCVLRVALFRLQQRPEDAHTTVDQAVTVLAILAHGRFRGLGNAVLRNYLRQKTDLEMAIKDKPVALWQHPAWWIRQLQAEYPQAWQTMLAAANQHPPMTLRVNSRHGVDATSYVAKLALAGIAARALDHTAVLLERPQSVEVLPGFAEGEVSVQDWGAQRAAVLLDAQPGMRVLDACAAPGGKTAHILERAGVDMTALEHDSLRARRIDENLQRLGLHATVKVADCADLPAWWDGQPFERILADVPCSATGVVRRHPDIKWLRRADDIGSFAATQTRILDALWQTLAPGGTMLYCTCSIFAAENGQQVERFLGRHADATCLPVNDNQPGWQLLPNAEQDGFYYARLHKRHE